MGHPAVLMHVVVSTMRLCLGVHCMFACQSVTGRCPVPSCLCPDSSARCGGVVEVGAQVQFCQGGGSGSDAVLKYPYVLVLCVSGRRDPLAARWPRSRWAGAGPGPSFP